MPSRVEIRPALRRDLRRILQIEASSFGRDAWDQRIFEDALEDSASVFLVARLSGRIAGYSITYIERRAAELVSIAVDPAYRRRDVGETLMNYTQRELAPLGVSRWRLMVRIDNEEAIGFYRRLGFTRARTVRGYYGRGVDAWRMELRL